MTKFVPLTGSETPAGVHAYVSGDVSSNEQITVTVRVKSKAEGSIPCGATADHATFEAQFGADPAVISSIEYHAKSHGLTVLEADACKRQVVLHGPVSKLEAAFNVKLHQFSHENGTFRSHTGPVHLPDTIAAHVEAVLGLTNRPVAKPHFQLRRARRNASLALLAHASGGPQPILATEVAKLYNFPTGFDGTGTTIGIVELGGGYKPNDMKRYFQSVKLPVPTLVDVSVNGGKNTPGSDADGEVELDIQVAGSVAPKAKLAVYFADNSTQGFVGAITQAAHDTVNKPDIISISWGGPEPTWTFADMAAMNTAIRDATILGVTVLVAAGDAGSNDGVGDKLAHADFPASSPYALACGGTCLVATSQNAIASETIWNDASDSAGGGGVSHHYPVPSYQKSAGVPTVANGPYHYTGRGVPDVSGNADPNSGYITVIDGSGQVVGGTSAVAPLYAGLLALIVQAKGKRLGFINTVLYSTAHIAFRQITASGNNGAYQGQPTDFWNPCSGLGSIDGTKLLNAL